ncbi:hypothetical protein ACS0TY_005738 [Phlomoides rotata]
MGGKKMWFILLVAVVLMRSCTAQPEASKNDCMKQCITDCADKGGSMCIVTCSAECNCTLSLPSLYLNIVTFVLRF